MMGGLQVALRTLSVEGFRSGGRPTPLLAPEPVQKILRSTYLLAGRRLADWGSRRCEGLQGLFPGQRSAAFCGADHRRGRGCGGDLQGFLPGRRVGSTAALRGPEPRGALRLARAQPGLVLVAPFSDVKKHMKSTGNLDIVSTSPFICHTPALVFMRQSTQASGRISCVSV